MSSMRDAIIMMIHTHFIDLNETCYRLMMIKLMMTPIITIIIGMSLRIEAEKEEKSCRMMKKYEHNVIMTNIINMKEVMMTRLTLVDSIESTMIKSDNIHDEHKR